jgi:GH35 family endo-1,4-beta-xylanase
LNAFETVANSGDNYGTRIRGFLNAPITGEYTFYVAGDETAELWLSNSSDSANKQLIASVPSATLVREWTKFPSQRSSVINLVAGQTYSIEALHKEGLGADHLAVGWTQPNQSTIEVIAGQHLSPVLPTVSLFTENPMAYEGAGGSGRVTVVRSGTSTVNPLTVAYALRGTAINGTDYNTLSGTILIPAGQSTANIDLDAINDSLTERSETVILELVDAADYEVDRLSQRTAHLTVQDDANAPAGGVASIAGSALTNFSFFGGTYTTVTDPTYGSVVQASVPTLPAAPTNSQLRQLNNAPIKASDILLLEFYVQSVGTSGEAKVVFESVANSSMKSLDQGIYATPTWTRVQLPFTALETYAAGQARFAFHLAGQVQTLRFHGVQLLNYGPSSKMEPSNLVLSNNGGSFGTMQTVSVTGQSFATAKQIDTINTPPNNENFRLSGQAKSESPVMTGDTVEYEFWARAVAGTTPRVRVVLQETYGTFASLRSNLITLTSAWQKYTFTFTTTKDYAANDLRIAFNVGYAAPQSVQIGGFTWRNTSRGVLMDSLPHRTTSVTYVGRSGTDSWRTEADARIAQNRMGNLNVQVVDTSGTPINGAVVQIKQKKQGFLFGSAINDTDGLLTTTSGADSLKYQSEIKRLFNAAVLTNSNKWPGTLSNPQLGVDSANWAVANGLYFRGHNIVWPGRSKMPSSIWAQYDSILASQGATAAADYLRTTVRARVTDATTSLRGIASEWDVVNETFSNHDVMDILGEAELLEWYRMFRTIDPSGKRALNDYGIFARNGMNTSHRADFDYWLGQLKGQNLIEIIGEQSHYDESELTDIAVLGQLLQSYNTTFNIPIAITEFDFDSRNEQLQADYLRDYLTMSFSQPGVSKFMLWGFWSREHGKPDAALYRDDFSIKPNGQAYEDLVFGDWWSSTRGTTRNGQFASKVFAGDFDVIVSWNGQTISAATTVGSAGTSLNVVLPGFHVLTNIDLSSTSIEENNAPNAVVGTLSTTDSNATDAFTYSLVAGAGSDDSASFQIVGNTLRVVSSLDFESKSSYSIRVRTTDQTGLSFEKPLTISVLDVNENPLAFNPAAQNLLRNQLLTGVSQIADVGQEGTIAVFGNHATSILQDSGKSVIAAVDNGVGRILAAAKTSYASFSNATEFNTGTFYLNSLNWLSKGLGTAARIVTDISAARTWLNSQGFTNVTLRSDWQNGLGTADVLVTNFGNPTVAQQNATKAFLDSGKGMFVGYNGWAYSDGEAKTSGGNALLRRYGLSWTEDVAWTYTGAITRSTEYGNAVLSATVELNPANYTVGQKAEAMRAIKDTFESVTVSDPQLVTIRQNVLANASLTIPSPAAPVTDANERVRLNIEAAVLPYLPANELFVHRTASTYGEIPTGSQRVSKTLAIHVNATNTKDQWLSTGVYAAPGEVLTFTVPAGLVDQGWTWKIGSHDDDLNSDATKPSIKRMQFGTSRDEPINATTIQFGSVYGGTVYLVKPATSASANSIYSVSISNALEAPYFVLGQTTDADWINSIRNLPAPYAELQSSNVIITLSASDIRNLSNPTAVMTYWQGILASQDDLTNSPVPRTFQERVDDDLDISNGLMHAGYPIAAFGHNLANMVDSDSGDDWGFVHEFGHNHQSGYWTFGTETEITVNILSMRAYDSIGSVPDDSWNELWTATGRASRVTPFIAGGRVRSNAGLAVTAYAQLREEFGWEPLRQFFRQYQTDLPANLPTTDQQKRDQWVTRFSNIVGKNLGPFFNAWGFNASQTALNAVAALPAWSMIEAVTPNPSFSTPRNTSVTFDPRTGFVDIMASPLTASFANPPEVGSLVTNGNGTFTYTPPADWTGRLSFPYAISNTQGGVSSGTVTLDVVSQSVVGTPIDTDVRMDSPSTNRSASTTLLVDGSTSANQPAQTLLQFSSLFGAGTNQIPANAVITKATLQLQVTDPGGSVVFHRMLSPWSHLDTWNTLNGGIQTNGIEAALTPDLTTPAVTTGVRTYDVTNSVQTWNANPSTNYGWALMPTSTDGINISSADSANPPRLMVDYYVLASPTITLTSSNQTYNHLAYVASATVTQSSAPAPTLAFAYYSDAYGTNPIDAPKNVGTYYVRAMTAANVGNNASQSAIVPFQITPRNLTASVTASNKVYDANVSAVVTVGLSGILGSDLVSGSASGSFGDKNVGTAKTVTIGSVLLSGTDAGNYAVGSAATTTADIAPRLLAGSIAAENKVFDGTTSATIQSRTLTGVLGLETVNYVGGVATFDTASVGTNKTVAATGLSLSGADAGNYQVNTVAFATANITPVQATIASRKIFYNNATGPNLSSAGAAANAIASDKSALLPGQSSTFANYTSYSRGLNGIIVDISNLPSTTSQSQLFANLQFAHWNGLAAAGFVALPSAAIPSVSILNGSGTGGSARVKITFPDNSLQNTWLRVTVLAGAVTGLVSNDVFYFGNVIGDVNLGNTATRLRVNGQDTSAILANQSPSANSATAFNIYDLDRNGRVNGQDTSIVLANQQAGGIVAPIVAPSGFGSLLATMEPRPFATVSNTVTRPALMLEQTAALMTASTMSISQTSLKQTKPAQPLGQISKKNPTYQGEIEGSRSVKRVNQVSIDEYFTALGNMMRLEEKPS